MGGATEVDRSGQCVPMRFLGDRRGGAFGVAYADFSDDPELGVVEIHVFDADGRGIMAADIDPREWDAARARWRREEGGP